MYVELILFVVLVHVLVFRILAVELILFVVLVRVLVFRTDGNKTQEMTT